MICAKNLDVYYGQNTAVYTLNLTGISSQKSKPPYELYYKVVPDIKHLRVFGTVVYTHIPKQKRQKWDPKSPKGIFVGYSNSTKGYRVWYSKTYKISVCRDIIFGNECKKFENIITDKLDFTETQINSTGVQTKDEQTIVDDRNVMVLRDRSTLKKPDRYNIHTFIAKCINPLNYDETMTGPNKNEWEHAMHDEITSLYENETWSLVDLPQDKVALRNAWVFKPKYKTDGSLDKFKARLVIKGCSQKYGIDYHNTFSPVVRYESTREILAVAAVEKLILRQFDIKTAFLYGDLQEEISMVQPKGFVDGSNKVCKLQRSLYGLKQAPRCWNLRFKHFLNTFGLQCTEADACVFKADNSQIILAIFVDDGLIAADNEDVIEELLPNLEKEFEVKKGNLEYFLVIENKSIIGNLQDVQHNIDNETIESDPLENEVLPRTITSQLRKQKMTDFQKSVVEVLAKRKISNDNEDLDEDKLFLLSLLPTLKKMSSDKKFDFKTQILQLLKNINFQNNFNLPLNNNSKNQLYPYPVQTNIANNYQSIFLNQMPILC
ncbi:hypothetical protein QTP88_011757 [Uroleucon formosanum]